MCGCIALVGVHAGACTDADAALCAPRARAPPRPARAAGERGAGKKTRIGQARERKKRTPVEVGPPVSPGGGGDASSSMGAPLVEPAMTGACARVCAYVRGAGACVSPPAQMKVRKRRPAPPDLRPRDLCEWHTRPGPLSLPPHTSALAPPPLPSPFSCQKSANRACSARDSTKACSWGARPE